MADHGNTAAHQWWFARVGLLATAEGVSEDGQEAEHRQRVEVQHDWKGRETTPPRVVLENGDWGRG